ncbi:MAG: phosphate ABC transporter permease subunit PstC, partial [Rhodospirillales bacterium]|nr:phosphate ABC transporter permease subunit PstC [Rhodospirillales bacterium]
MGASSSAVRVLVERLIVAALFSGSLVAVLTTVGITLTLVFESFRFFQMVPVSEFLFGLYWSPQTAIRVDQVGATGQFGAVPLIAGTLLISVLALSISAPVGLLSAIYLTEYASDRTRAVIKPTLEILAGVPTVVYGFFAVLIVAPILRGGGEWAGFYVSSESALAAALVMGVMTIPFVSSIADDALVAVPRSLKDGALALGATHSEMVRQVLLPAALPGIMGGLLLAASRVVGE